MSLRDSNGNILLGTGSGGGVEILEYTNQAAFPATGLVGKIYVDKAENKLFRWNGSAYSTVGDGAEAEILEYTNQAAFPATGLVGKIYVDKAEGKLFRWDGSAYAAVGGSDTTIDAQDVASASSILALSSSTSIVRITGSIITSIKGIVAPTENQLLEIINVSDKPVTIVHESSEATAGNRLKLVNDEDQLMKPNGSVSLIYDLSSTRWISNRFANEDAPYISANRTSAISIPIGWTTVSFENIPNSRDISFSDANKNFMTFSQTGIFSITISHQGGTGYESDTAWRIIDSDSTVIATGAAYTPSTNASSSSTILFEVTDLNKNYALQIGRSTSTFDIAVGPTISGTQLPNIKFQIFSADKVGPQGPRGADGTPADRKELEFKTGTADDYTTPKVYTMWEGTEAQYNAITTKDANTRYWITDDTTGGGGAVADDTAYGASWDGNTDAATKNVIYDKIETIIPSVTENLVTDWSGNWGHYADGTYNINSVFYKDPITGLVFINMTAWNTGATSASVWSSTPLCTIPVGYRPVAAWVFCGASSSEGGLVTRLDMQSNGAMRIYTGKGRWVTANFVFKGA